MKTGDEDIKFTEQGILDHYLGVEVVKKDCKLFELQQPYLIKKIVDHIGLMPDVKCRENPVCLPLLHKDLDGLKHKQSWHFRSAIGMLSYLWDTSQPEMYLSTTADREIVYDPNPNLGIQHYVDTDFAGSWSNADTGNPENVMLHTDFVIMYAGCLVLWQSKLQTEIALSTAEAEYIFLSFAIREVILFMNLLEELSKVFEDNKSCIAIAKVFKFNPRTKHIALKYHHFKNLVDEGNSKPTPSSKLWLKSTVHSDGLLVKVESKKNFKYRIDSSKYVIWSCIYDWKRHGECPSYGEILIRQHYLSKKQRKRDQEQLGQNVLDFVNCSDNDDEQIEETMSCASHPVHSSMEIPISNSTDSNDIEEDKEIIERGD
eukprot:3301368-Ditylum_brightwellii.AAC.1